MNAAAFPLEMITPGFTGGAKPEAEAEIRAASIRGQLRWWFRALGGFKSLAHLALPQQETLVFGGESGSRRTDTQHFQGGARTSHQASPLLVRISSSEPARLRTRCVKNAEDLHAPLGSDRGYLLFPLHHLRRALFDLPTLPKFDLVLVWLGDSHLWEDLMALATVYGHLGSLGFRSRRGWGALAFQTEPPHLPPALAHFAAPHQIEIKKLPARNTNDAIATLAHWLRGWRAYGRPQDSGRSGPRRPGSNWAKNDHDAGRNRNLSPAYRPALGLPLVQRYSGSERPVVWNYGPGTPREPGGHFASPVLLRPYRAAANQWLGLVIFLEAHRWPPGRKVWIAGQPRAVSTELYEAMKKDPALQPFWP